MGKLYGAAPSRVAMLGATTSAPFEPASVVARLIVSGRVLSYTTRPLSSLRYLRINDQGSATSVYFRSSESSQACGPSAKASPSYEKMRGSLALTMPFNDENKTSSSSAWLRVTPTQST